MVEGCTEMYS
jgi:uncharacterized protein YoxC